MPSTREELVESLLQLNHLFPDMRFGQLISMVCRHATSPNEPDLYGVEDAAMLKACREIIEFNSHRAPVTLPSPDSKSGQLP
jgi:hypothetical protein